MLDIAVFFTRCFLGFYLLQAVYMLFFRNDNGFSAPSNAGLENLAVYTASPASVSVASFVTSDVVSDVSVST